MTRRIFISSVQRELAAERKAVVDGVSANPQLARFFSTFAFEFDVPVQDKRTDEIYLSELASSDVYVCIIGNEYGGITPDGISATECEYDEATRLGLPRFVFVKGKSDARRDKRERAFLRKLSPGVIRLRFTTTDELLRSLAESLDKYLADNKVAYSGFTYEEEPVGRWEDLDEDKIRWFVRTAREKRGFPIPEDAPAEKVLRHLRMVTDDVPNRAAMLCFGREAHLFATSPGVKCLLWYGKERKKPAGSYKWFEGNLFEVSDKAIEFVKEKLDLRIGGHTLGAQSDDTFEIDERIVTEMINNGIAHRDYASSATVQVELFKDRLTVFSPGPFHPDMKFEMLSADHQSYATNPIIARALYFVQYIEEVGSGTTDIFEHCASHGLEPPIFEVDARHVSVTVMRPTFDEHGRKVGQKMPEVGAKGTEVGQKTSEVGQKNAEVGAKGTEVGQKVDFGALASVGRKDFRMMCERVFKCLAKDSRMSRRRISQVLGIAESTVQCATNALQEVGLLRREGRGKGSNWIVAPEPSHPMTKPIEPRTNARKPITKRRVSAKKGKEAK